LPNIIETNEVFVRIFFILLSSILFIGCAGFDKTLQRTFSHDRMTPEERAQKQAEYEAQVEYEKLAFETCMKNAFENKFTDMKRWETCSPPERKGLAKNNSATFYLWYDGNEPYYAYFDKEGKFLIEEIDDETINARRLERKQDRQHADNKNMQLYQIWSAQQNSNNLNRTIQKQNCINRSSPGTAMYCN